MNSGQDKVLDHTREQLSALFDGELALDEARFLQRRLQHDATLAACVSRWQAIGDVLRGQASAPAPDGFAERVATAVAAEAAPLPARRAAAPRRGWVPGAALAASVALVAFFAMRQSPAPAPAGQAPATEVAQAVVPDTSSPGLAATDPTVPSQPAPQAPGQQAAQLAAAVAVAEVPRRAAARRATASRGQAQRAAATRAERNGAAAQPQYAVAGAPAGEAATLQAVAAAAAADNPFAPPATATPPAAARPWPRALLPNAGGVFNVGYGNLDPSGARPAEDFHPFRIRPSERSSTDE